jgi:hypothetical protein
MTSSNECEWSRLDAQMRQYSPRLRDDLRIEAAASNHLATTVAQECAALPSDALADIREQDVVGLHMRLEELIAFQAFMDLAHSIPSHPAVVRAQVITQNYICFVNFGRLVFQDSPATRAFFQHDAQMLPLPDRQPDSRVSQRTRARQLVLQRRFQRTSFLGTQGHRPERAINRVRGQPARAWFLAGPRSLCSVCRLYPCNERGLTNRWS